MRLRTPLSPTRPLIALSVAAVLVAVVAGSVVAARRPPQPPPKAHVTQTAACTDPAVVADLPSTPLFDPAVAARRVTVPAGEPAIVATVNGDPITAVFLEELVSLATAMRLRTHQPLEAPAQLRAELLNTQIDERLAEREIRRLGITIPEAQAQAKAQQVVRTFESWPAGDPARVQFEAYLCLNGLDASTFATDPRIVEGYRSGLARAALNQRIWTAFSSGQHGPITEHAAIDAYFQRLRQAATIHIFIPLG